MYSYQTERPGLFTEEGSVMFTAIRDKVHALLNQAGAVRCDKAISAARSGSSWMMLACMDRLVELGEVKEITGPDTCGQYRVFVSARD